MPLSFDFATVRGTQRRVLFFKKVFCFYNFAPVIYSFLNDTPSPNLNFTDFSSPAVSEPGHSGRTLVGAIIGGAVGGLTILGLSGLFFLRRNRRRSRHRRPTAIIDIEVDDNDIPSGDTATPVVEVTPYIIPNYNSKVTQVSDDTSASYPTNAFAEPASNSEELASLQAQPPTLFTSFDTDSRVVESSTRDDQTDQPQENSSISRVSLARERDAGRFVDSRRLPPAYDENWRHNSYQPLSSPEANRNESISGRDGVL